jgi:antitoxin ParD1/3/4
MQTMNISLPEAMQEFVEEQVIAGDYRDASEYIRDLVRADQKRQAKVQLEQVLLSAVGSGDAMELTPEMIEGVRDRLRARNGERRAGEGRAGER